MNNKQRKILSAEKARLETAHDTIESVREAVEEMYGEENDKYNNLPESLQESEKGMTMEEIADMLCDIASDLDDVSCLLSDAIGSIEEVISR